LQSLHLNQIERSIGFERREKSSQQVAIEEAAAVHCKASLERGTIEAKGEMGTWAEQMMQTMG